MSVCLCVCLSTRVTRKPRGRSSPFLCILPVAVARSSSDCVAIRYVLPVLRMTSCFHSMGPMGGRARRCLVGDAGGRGRWPGAGRCGPVARWFGGQACWAGLGCWAWRRRRCAFRRVLHVLVVSGAPPAKSSLYDCLADWRVEVLSKTNKQTNTNMYWTKAIGPKACVSGSFNHK